MPELDDLTDEGTEAPGVFAGREVTEELWKLERPDETGTAGTTKVEEDLLADFFTLFFAVFFTALFAVVFLAVVFLAAVFFTVFLADFFAVFLADFFAVFLTATVSLLGLYLKCRFKTQ